ncbi:C4-dicarboxylate ABC transporter permease [Acuticoccus sediminis]|uniref:TRAP transporter large permease protein n=1 Tax=Acuticoccus sediminis TaxID=2184697 RepID=A0A8B2NWH2_9HYPH|nr:TRAP transporter large permease subunit [Acuticoccus sediminis]RAI01864.1 C4-dicarboxylate ABC transporter permease [Acuticoccus sediminis]
MDPITLGIGLLVVLVLVLGLGVWIGAALLVVGMVAMELATSRPMGPAMATAVWSSISSWGLASLPLFVWMGEILYRARLAEGLFNGLSPMLRRLPGGLLHVNVAGCTAFAAISGSSAATLMTVGKMTMPELKKRGYPDRLVAGSLAGAGTLGLLIPPSITMILYGVLVQESIARLFLAGVLPGLMLAGLFVTYLVVWGLVTPQGRALREERATPRQILRGFVELLPVVGLIVLVIGSIYAGIAAPTEAAALGVVGALILAASRRELTFAALSQSLMATVRTTSMIVLLVAGSAFVTMAMGFTGLPRDLAAWINAMSLSPTTLILVLLLFYMLLGCVLDGISMIVLTIAIVEGMVRAAGIDMVWFGVFVVLVGEMALITPPIGFNLFLVQGLTGRSILFVALAAAPFFLLMATAVALLIAFPQIALWLPSLMTARG